MKELINIQSELKAPKNQYNGFGKYKYRSCEDVLEAVKPLLKKNNCTLTISDVILEVAGLVFVEAIATIVNEKGNDIAVSAQAGINPNKKGMDIAQSFGSSSSYARKYALNGLFLIDDTKDADTEKPVTPVKAVKKPINTKGKLTEDRFKKALEQVEAGKYDAESMRATFLLTPMQERQLEELLTETETETETTDKLF
jgi:hypothetical protein